MPCCGCATDSEAPPKPAPPVTVQTVLPKRGEIARTITLPSFRILAYQEATLYAKVSGYLKTLTVDKGDAVKEGQLLAEIEVPELLADEAQYKAETRGGRTNYERMAEARQKAPDLVVPQTVDDLRGQWEVAQAKLQRTQTLLQYARIIAPFAGVITARFVDPGAFIPAATAGSTPQSAAMLTLMDYSRVRVQVFVPEPEVPFIKNGVPVSDGGRVARADFPGHGHPFRPRAGRGHQDHADGDRNAQPDRRPPARRSTPACSWRSSASQTRCSCRCRRWWSRRRARSCSRWPMARPRRPRSTRASTTASTSRSLEA